MYRHDNPLKPHTDMRLWIGGALLLRTCKQKPGLLHGG